MSPQHRLWTLIALLMASFLAAVDITIVETAMPRIVGSLGGFPLLTWVVTGYMLTSTATVPIYGKLSDVIGRKRTFTIGAIIFISGSALCGLAQSMEQLILFRCLQGLGAGALMPTVQTIIGDLYTPSERARVQAWFSALWGFSGLIGPLLGGLIVDHATWRWLFYINLPLGTLALVLVWRLLHERVERRSAQIDYLGASTLTAALVLTLYLLLMGGQHGYTAPASLAALAGAVGLFALFIWHERRAADPILPFPLFARPEVGLPVLSGFLIGGLFFGFTVYLPIWAQGVQGFSATRSGASLLWLSLGWPLATMLGSRMIMKLGMRPAVLLGLSLNLTASLGLVLAGRLLPTLPEWLLGLITFAVGSGMGFTVLSFTLGVQNAVEWQQRGVATASLQFMRTMGGLVWVSVMGGVMNTSLFRGLQSVPGITVRSANEAGELANALLDPLQWGSLPAGQVSLLRESLAAALRNVHLIVLVLAVGALAVATLIRNVQFKPQPGVQPAGPSEVKEA